MVLQKRGLLLGAVDDIPLGKREVRLILIAKIRCIGKYSSGFPRRSMNVLMGSLRWQLALATTAEFQVGDREEQDHDYHTYHDSHALQPRLDANGRRQQSAERRVRCHRHVTRQPS